jgi:hypothetical protein
VDTSFLIDLSYINHTQDAKQDAKLRISVWQNIKMKENALEHLFCLVIPTIQITGVLKMDFQKPRNAKIHDGHQLGISTRNDINFHDAMKFGG